jgi:hypothetical protein
MRIALASAASMLEEGCAVQKSRPKKHRIPVGVVNFLCKGGIIEWRRVLQCTLEKYGQKRSRQVHAMKGGGGIWGRRCCGGVVVVEVS